MGIFTDRHRQPHPNATWSEADQEWRIPIAEPATAAEAFDQVASTSDARVINNTMRHAYRVLSDDEKALMQQIKDEGLAFHELIASMGGSREISLAKTKVEEAVMWAVKHLTA